MYKCAEFDIKPTYNRQIFIPGVHLHSPKISDEASGGPDLWLRETYGPWPGLP